MKTTLRKKPTKPGTESTALFSRLSGVGMTGFISHPLLQEEEITIPEKNNITVEDKTKKNGSLCHDQQHCQQQFQCQPGKCQNAPATIDLWF